MQENITFPHRLNSVTELLSILDITEKDCLQAISKGYRRYKKYKNGKYRWIEEPNTRLKEIQQKLHEYLQVYLDCPPYCMAGFKTQNNIKNAQKHIKKREVITMDISHYFPNTKTKYVEDFFVTTFGATGKLLNLLMDITTYNGYLPTGGATSTLLSCFAHKNIFDSIYRKMQALNIDMTIYVDDITLSTNKHIGNWVIKYINNALKTHGLWLKKSKVKRFGYKYAVVTGVHISQCGRLLAPFKIGHSVIKTLQEKDLSMMTVGELQSLIAKIGYIRQLHPKKLAVTKDKAITQLKKLQKQQQKK